MQDIKHVHNIKRARRLNTLLFSLSLTHTLILSYITHRRTYNKKSHLQRPDATALLFIYMYMRLFQVLIVWFVINDHHHQKAYP